MPTWNTIVSLAAFVCSLGNHRAPSCTTRPARGKRAMQLGAPAGSSFAWALRSSSSEEHSAPEIPIPTAISLPETTSRMAKSTLPHRDPQSGPGLQNASIDSEAVLAAKPEPNQVPTAPGGPVRGNCSSWPPAPPKLPLTIFSRPCSCLPKGGAGSALKVLKLV